VTAITMTRCLRATVAQQLILTMVAIVKVIMNQTKPQQALDMALETENHIRKMPFGS